MNQSSQLWVFVIANPTWPDLVEIGTSTSPGEEIVAHNRMHPFGGFTYACVEPVPEVITDSLIRDILAEHHLRERWYNMPADDAARALKAICREVSRTSL